MASSFDLYSLLVRGKKVRSMLYSRIMPLPKALLRRIISSVKAIESSLSVESVFTIVSLKILTELSSSSLLDLKSLYSSSSIIYKALSPNCFPFVFISSESKDLAF